MGNVASSVDRTYTDDTRYLFVIPDDSDGPPFHDNICNGTEEWTEDFAQYRPADWREPVVDDGSSEGEATPGDEPTSAERDESDEPASPPAEEPTPKDEVLTTVRKTGNGEDYDGRLFAAAGLGLLGLLALGWWVRKEG